MMYVLDTNILIYFFKGQGNVAAQLLRRSPSEIGIPSIVLYELETGIAKSNSPAARTKQLKELCSLAQPLPFAAAEAHAAAHIRAQLEKKGRPIGPYDILIAGTAWAHRATLVTNNTKEFSRIDKLKVENWFY